MSRKFISVMSVTAAAAIMFIVPATSIAESDVEVHKRVAPIQALRTQAQQQEVQETAEVPVYKVKASADGRSHIKIKWSKVDGAQGYTVYRSSDAKKLGKKVYTTKKTSKKSFKDENVAIDKKYYYTVRAWSKADGDDTTIAAIKSNRVKNSLKYESSFKAKTYAYSGGGTTASGKKAQVGLVAVDPKVIKLGTWLYIEDYGLCQAADTGGSIKGNKVDLYMDSISECYDWGVRNKKVYILE
jgi:3D (Asp-Asp-Asp) domain-containing protein